MIAFSSRLLATRHWYGDDVLLRRGLLRPRCDGGVLSGCAEVACDVPVAESCVDGVELVGPAV